MVRPLVSLLVWFTAMGVARAQGTPETTEPPPVLVTPDKVPTPAPSVTPTMTPEAPRAPDPDEEKQPELVIPAKTDDERRSGPARKRDATMRQIYRGPFRTSRLFAMPTADVIGAFMLSVSGDGSLLQETGLLTSAGVVAAGFGDIAQLEYRHSAAISISGVNAPIPAAGVQLKVPLPEYNALPAFGVSFRLGVPRTEQFGMTTVEERVSDLYVVGRLHIDQIDWLTLHGGTRISSAQIDLSGDATGTAQRTMWLPTAGYDIRMNPQASIVGEIALAPRFKWTPDTTDAPTIDYGLLGRLGVRWAMFPSVIIDGSIGYQLEVANARLASGPDDVVHWDIRLGAEVFVPWGALACRAAGAFCD